MASPPVQFADPKGLAIADLKTAAVADWPWRGPGELLSSCWALKRNSVKNKFLFNSEQESATDVKPGGSQIEYEDQDPGSINNM